MDLELQIDKPAYCMLPLDIDGVDRLAELALDLRWSWNHRTDGIWRELDPVLWSITHNPWAVLQTVSRERLKAALGNRDFRKEIDELVQIRRARRSESRWYQNECSHADMTCVAYFSLEFMLSEALPIYSGGLGNVAGDQLKAASDLGVPVIGVGLLYQQGYFRQIIDKQGGQQELFPYNDPGQLPITPLRESNGEWLRLEISLPGYSIWLRAWRVQVGSVDLYLLDTNDPANFPAHRGITSELYGGGLETRLKQELVLGIGGWRLLSKLGIKPEVCHLNEGHAAFTILERARCFMEETHQPFNVALATTRAGNVFTTHTAVAAGFDRFPPALIEQYLGNYAQKRLAISVAELLALGRQNPKDNSEPFNMAYLALRGSGAVNGVSRLHGKVSRRLFSNLFERWPEAQIPIRYVTNGVHVPTWDAAAADDVWTQACGKGRWLGATETLEKDIRSIPNEKLWLMRTAARDALVHYARERLARQLAASGALQSDVEIAKHIFDSNALTMGFARRFATYKRPDLLLQDPERLVRLLTNPKRPVQLIIAGKAHPEDRAGKAMIEQWTAFMRQTAVRPHIMFLADYDIDLTMLMVQGVDLWINTPRRPWEACGTSGMKVLVNGGLNLSELDGWWAEAYAPDVGWALGDGREHGDDHSWDVTEARQLYELLETQIIPQFYDKDTEGIPVAWVSRVRESMARLTPRFCANRAVREYTRDYYIPAAGAYSMRRSKDSATGRRIVQWQQELEQSWGALRFGDVTFKTEGDCFFFEVQVYLDEIDPGNVRIELYADGDNSEPFCMEMTQVRQLIGSSGGYVYSARVPACRPETDYTPRIVPFFPGTSVPLEAKQILWQK